MEKRTGEKLYDEGWRNWGEWERGLVEWIDCRRGSGGDARTVELATGIEQSRWTRSDADSTTKRK